MKKHRRIYKQADAMLLFKIKDWEKSGKDENISGFIWVSISCPKSDFENIILKKEGITIQRITKDIFTFRGPVSGIVKVLDMKLSYIVKIELKTKAQMH